MDGISPISLRTAAKLTAAALAFAAATGVAFAAWIDNDAGIFRSMVEAGLAWCM